MSKYIVFSITGFPVFHKKSAHKLFCGVSCGNFPGFVGSRFPSKPLTLAIITEKGVGNRGQPIYMIPYQHPIFGNFDWKNGVDFGRSIWNKVRPGMVVWMFKNALHRSNPARDGFRIRAWKFLACHARAIESKPSCNLTNLQSLQGCSLPFYIAHARTRLKKAWNSQSANNLILDISKKNITYRQFSEILQNCKIPNVAFLSTNIPAPIGKNRISQDLVELNIIFHRKEFYKTWRRP